jgi:signal transduction histidine kinase
MTIEDNGEGFDPDAVLHEVRAGHHIGLRSMQQRIEDARGGMDIHSSPSQGTRLEFWCPLPEEAS